MEEEEEAAVCWGTSRPAARCRLTWWSSRNKVRGHGFGSLLARHPAF